MSEGLLRGLFALLSWIPLPLQYLLGEILGSLMALFPNRHRRVSLRNLELCFPDLDKFSRTRLMIRSLCEMTRTVLETPLIWRADRQRIDKLVRRVEGLEHLQHVLSQGHGAIIAAPHLGSWELLGQYLHNHAPLTALFKPTDKPAVNTLMTLGRGHLGIEMAAADTHGVRRLFSALKKGGMLFILPDQDPRNTGGVYAPFFGIQTMTMTLLPKLAARSQVPCLVCYAERLSWGRGYIIHILPSDPHVNSADSTISATAMNSQIERAVRQIPAQYQWSYKRFRSHPEGEPPRYSN